MSTAPSEYVQPVLPTEGHLGYLTSKEILQLKEFWGRLLEIFDGVVPFDQTVPSSFKGQVREDDSSDSSSVVVVQKAGWFGRGKAPTGNSAPEKIRFTGLDLQKAFWRMTMMNHPDSVLLKYIRARKWVIEDALTMYLNALKWRIVERVDELTALSDVELDAKSPKFIEQMRMGKGYLHGSDPLGRVVSVINTRMHRKADQPPETIHRFTIYNMEIGRTLLPEGTDTVIVLFDLSSFGLDNMDWAFVRLFVQCFESYYPETLGVCIVHRAPFVFWGIWKLIQPLLDPIVVKKFVFTRNNAELHKIIPRDRLPINHYEGLDDWTYEYVPAREGENDHMKDLVKKEELLNERRALEERYDTLTRAWIKEPESNTSDERDEVAKALREQYARLSPYTRAVSLYQRWGVAGDGKVNWTYNVKTE